MHEVVILPVLHGNFRRAFEWMNLSPKLMDRAAHPISLMLSFKKDKTRRFVFSASQYPSGQISFIACILRKRNRGCSSPVIRTFEGCLQNHPRLVREVVVDEEANYIFICKAS
jgi:hypothetical protein